MLLWFPNGFIIWHVIFNRASSFFNSAVACYIESKAISNLPEKYRNIMQSSAVFIIVLDTEFERGPIFCVQRIFLETSLLASEARARSTLGGPPSRQPQPRPCISSRGGPSRATPPRPSVPPTGPPKRPACSRRKAWGGAGDGAGSPRAPGAVRGRCLRPYG